MDNQGYIYLEEEKVSFNGTIKHIDPKKYLYIPLTSIQANAVEIKVKKDQKVKIGTLIAKVTEPYYLPIYSTVSGTVKNFVKMPFCLGNNVTHCLIENDFQYQKELLFDIENIDELTSDQLYNICKKSGLVGCSGAGFPTYCKNEKHHEIDTLIINCIECEGYLSSDYVNILNNPEKLLAGSLALGKMHNVRRIVLAIKKTYPDIIDLLLKSIETNEKFNGIELYLSDDNYPAGYERVLTKNITNRTYNLFTDEVNVIVNNASTAITFYDILTTGLPMLDKLVTVGGDGIKENGHCLVRIGTLSSDIIADYGGLVSENVDIYCGGSMMGSIMKNDYAIYNSYNGLTVLKKKVLLEERCDNCGKCNEACCHNLDVISLLSSSKDNDKIKLEQLKLDECIECGICSYVCPKHIDVRRYLQNAKSI